MASRAAGFVVTLWRIAGVCFNSPSIDKMPGSIIAAIAAGISHLVTNGQSGPMVGRDDHKGLASCENAQSESANDNWQAVKDKRLKLYDEVAAAETRVTSKARAGEGGREVRAQRRRPGKFAERIEGASICAELSAS